MNRIKMYSENKKKLYLTVKIQLLANFSINLYIKKDSIYLSFSISAFSLANTSKSPSEVPATTLLIAGASACLRAVLLWRGLTSSLPSSNVRE